MLVIAKLRRYLALLLFTIAASVGAFGAVTLSPGVGFNDDGTVCPGSPFEVRLKGQNPKDYYFYYYSIDGGVKWEKNGYSNNDGHALIEFPAGQSELKVKAERLDPNSGAVLSTSSVLTVTGSTSVTCSKMCHQTMTGDYLNGTDFNPAIPDPDHPCPPKADGTPKVPCGVENYFGESGIIYDYSSYDGYQVRNEVELKDFFGVVPTKDDSAGVAGRNYYFTYKNNGNTYIAKIKYNPDDVLGTPYQFKMRLYIQPEWSCMRDQSFQNKWSNAKFIARTGHGNQTNDLLTAQMFLDKTGEALGPEITRQGGATSISFGDMITNWNSLPDPSGYRNNSFKETKPYPLIRLEVTYFGSFPLSSNGLEFFTFDPMFEQFDCAKVAVDYISADVASVCMDPGAVCVGDVKTVNAAGFPRGAKYCWERETKDAKGNYTGRWEPLVIDGKIYDGSTAPNHLNVSRVDIPAISMQDHYRVYDADQSHDGADKTVRDFYVYGDPNCVPPEAEIDSTNKSICLPTSKEDVLSWCINGWENYMDEPSIHIKWKLIDPKGNEVQDKTVIVSDTAQCMRIKLPQTAIEGTYKIVASIFKDGANENRPISSDTLEVNTWRTPTAKFLVDGFPDNSGAVLCPSDKHIKLVATHDASGNPLYKGHKYSYLWCAEPHADGVSGKPHEEGDDKGHLFCEDPIGDGHTANVNWAAGDRTYCNGKNQTRTVGLTVKDETTGCKAYWDHTYKVADPVDPTIDCDEIQKAFSNPKPDSMSAGDSKTVRRNVYYLKRGEKQIEVKLPVIKVGGTCDQHPEVTITATGKDVLSNELKFPTITAELDKLDSVLSANKLHIPATAGKSGVNGVTVTYFVKDGCGNTSTSCGILLIVRDTIGPEVPCNDVAKQDRITKLSNYNEGLDIPNNCSATPGTGNAAAKKDLPVIEAPTLPDLSGVDGNITGQYMGRYWTSEPGYTPDKFADKTFDSKVKVNDPYQPGYTFIRWDFKDAAGNFTPCLQKITVVDNLAPVMVCPDNKDSIVSSREDACGLSLEDLLNKIPDDKIPSAKEYCPAEKSVPAAKTIMSYRELPKGSFKVIEDPKKIIFNVDKEYEVMWQFFKNTGPGVDDAVHVDCIQKYVITDSVAPKSDCDHDGNKVVFVDRPSNGIGQNKNYASAEGDGNYTHDLQGFFTKIATATDNCDGPLSPVVTITTPDGKSTDISKKGSLGANAILAELKKFHFLVGENVISYTFTDKKGNVTVCEQAISVTDGIDMHDCEPKITLTADENCEAKADISLSNVKTATATLLMQYREKKYMAAWFHGTFPELVTQDDDEMGDCDQFDFQGRCLHYSTVFGFNGLQPAWQYMNANKIPSVKKQEIFPIEVIKITNVDANGNKTADSKVESISNTNSNADEVVDKVVVHSKYGMWDMWNPEKVELQNYHSVNLTTKNFPKEFTDDFRTFSKGTHMLMWVYENGTVVRNGKVVPLRDTCKVTVTVIDSTGPSVTCGKFSQDVTVKSDPVTCKADVLLDVPTLEDLQASDNCDPVEKLTLSYKRGPKGAVTPVSDLTALRAPFEQGSTHIVWIVSDASGNDSTCEQNVIVNDSTGPIVDCEKLVKSPLNVLADANCEANADAMKAAGLHIPELDAAAELCSPIPGQKNIKGVGKRLDANGKEQMKDVLGEMVPMDVLEDPYSKGSTKIVWSFTDANGNTSTCDQVVNVEDKTAPVVLACDTIESTDLVYKLAPTECAAPGDKIDVLLGKHYGEDNCTPGLIEGVPYVKEANGNRALLPKEYKKDTTYVITWVFTDDEGNEKVCNQKLSIVDTTPPDTTGICPDPYKSVDANTVCALDFSDLDLPELSIDDQCDGLLKGVLSGEVMRPAGEMAYPSKPEDFENLKFLAGSINHFTWTFTDKAGLSSTCEMDVEIIDKIAPEIQNCNVTPNDTFPMSQGLCEATWDDIDDRFVTPFAYDECQELLHGMGPEPMDPAFVRRYYVGTVPAGFNPDTCKWADHLVKESVDGDTSWHQPNFQIGLNRVVWVFIDDAGNRDSCVKDLTIALKTGPDFDCEAIKPNPLVVRPNDDTSCVVKFADVDLSNHKYAGTNACTGETIPAKLLLGPSWTALPVPGSFSLAVGDTVRLWWVVTDLYRNSSSCPWDIVPQHNRPVDFDCKSLEPLKSLALEGECRLPAENVEGLKKPFAIDGCVPEDTVWAVPTRSDGLDLMDDYPTGKTNIQWMFVSKWNTNDTLFCNQEVSILGNKHFDFECDVLFPAIYDTLSDCGPANDIILQRPELPDPCGLDTLKDEDGNIIIDTLSNEPSTTAKMIKAVAVARFFEGEVVDVKDVYDDPFPLGATSVLWTFTDFTGNIVDSCYQSVTVQTNKPLDTPCDTAHMDTIVVPLPDDGCTVPFADVDFGDVFALNPCLGDTIRGEMSRNTGSIDAPFVIGLNKVTWTFTDNTGTLTNFSATCEQFVKVGDKDVEAVDCKNMPDQNRVLDPGNCALDFSDFGLTIPPFVDPCAGSGADAKADTILPDITRSSMPGVAPVHSPDLLGSFVVGVDTVFWSYNYAGNAYVCKQVIHIKDKVEPDFDCGSLLPVVAHATGDECEVDSSAVLALLRPYPKAVDVCTQDSIIGVPTLQDGSSLPSSFRVGDTVVIKWTFQDTLINVLPKVCQQSVTVNGEAEPKFDCSSLGDTLRFVIHGDCSVNLSADSFPVHNATDACKQPEWLVPGVPSRVDGNEIYGTYYTGAYDILWTFTSPFSSTPKTCPQVMHVITDMEIDAKCGKDNYPDIVIPVEDGTCTIPAAKVLAKIRSHVAENPCHSSWLIAGVATRSDEKEMDEDYPVGTTTITWTFTDTSNTLLNPVSTCEQIVNVEDANAPKFDCDYAFPTAKIYLDADNCTADFSQITVNFDAADMPVNKCNNDELAVLDTSRQSGAAMKDPYKVGEPMDKPTDIIDWKFTFESNNQSFVCHQEVYVYDTVAPNFDCKKLKPVITVALSVAGSETVTYEEVVKAGFAIPEVKDTCGEVKTTVTRSDGADIKAGYPMGETVVNFDFEDIHGNVKSCNQTIKVTDMIPPVVNCPKVSQGTLACSADTPPAFKTYDEFITGGGSVDDPTKIDPSTFGHKDVVIGDECSSNIVRDYFMLTIKNDTVRCEVADTFSVRDDIAPTYVGIPAAGQSVTYGCNYPSDIVPDVTALDNCDPEPTVSIDMTSTRGDDPTQCSYYNYEVIYTFVAEDRCGNKAQPVSFTINVRDTVKPDTHTPEHWEDEMYPTNMKNCNFGVPDITSLIPRDSVYLECESRDNLTFTQSPEAGSIIDETTTVYLYISDVCGNTDTLQKVVKVQTREEIVTVTTAVDPTVCGLDESLKNPRQAKNSLVSTSIREGSGNVATIDFDGTWTMVPTTLSWDYYRGQEASEENLVYSNNPQTFGSKFDDAKSLDSAGNAAYSRYVLLLRQKQSDYYTFVGYDTITGCSDTATAFVTVNERPRVSFITGDWDVCHGDSLSISGKFGDAFPACVQDMGSEITETGWYLNDSVYKRRSPVDYADGEFQTALFYATNGCGTTLSSHSLMPDCAAPSSHDDSLALAGSDKNLDLMRDGWLYFNDSVRVKVWNAYDPSQVMLTTNPQDKARTWEGDDATFYLNTPYTPAIYIWNKVVDEFDGATGALYASDGTLKPNFEYGDDEQLLYFDSRDTTGEKVENLRQYTLRNPGDTASYYVLVGNGVCPTVASNVVSMDVLHQLPTAITPYDHDGMNDEFMKGHHVIIFNRYGQQIFEGSNGWDGRYRGLLADPGVYFYSVDMSNGKTRTGSIEIVKVKE